MSEAISAERHSVWTIAALAVLAYCTANLLHEGLGHGGFCLLMGGKPEVLNAIFFDYQEASVSMAGRRWIAAGGSIVNVICGGVVLLYLRSATRLGATLHYGLWLFAAVNLLTAFGYLLFSGISGVGDWSVVVDGLGPPLLLRLGLSAAGALLYFWAMPKLLMPLLAPLVDASKPLKPQAFKLMRLPYLVGGSCFVAAGLLNPYGLELVLISAVAASFGGTSLLAWYHLRSDHRVTGSAAILTLPESRSLIVAAFVMLVFFIAVLGPGITLG